MVFWWLVLPVSAIASDQEVPELTIAERYQAFTETQGPDALPFTVDSGDDSGTLWASVQTFLVDIPFDLLAQRLSDITQWCEFIPLHLNVKACSYYLDSTPPVLSFYIGPKGYSAPDEVQVLDLAFQTLTEDDILTVEFTAPRGPFGSSNYDFIFRAMEVDGGVYLEFDLSSNPGLVSKLSKVYFLTVGSGKVGFSVMGKDRTGRVRYVSGERGGVERNIVRYLYSLQTYFDTINQENEEDIFRIRAEHWFDLTELHERQLYELPRETYLDIKELERVNQNILLEAIAQGVEPDFDTEKSNR